MRLQKFLARAGVASRRKCEDFIAAGRVRVDGELVTEPGTKVDPERQRVEVDGVVVELLATDWLALHKPPGFACSRDESRGMSTVYELIPPESQHLFHVGRLDLLSEGLLLFSNDGDLAHALLHPSSEVRRRYEVTLVSPAPMDLPQRLIAGVELDAGRAHAKSARWLLAPPSRSPILEVEIAEGRNREVRRMIALFELKIQKLCRVAFGPIELGDLSAGTTRVLSESEREALRGVHGLLPGRQVVNIEAPHTPKREGE